MATKFGFLSYGHQDKDAVFPLADWIEARGLELWYSRFMKPGSYEDQIVDRITTCSVVIAIITEAGAGPKSSGWVLRELMEANDADRVIFPCIIGDFKLGQELRRVIDRKHSVYAERIEDLIHDESFRFCIDALVRSEEVDAEATNFIQERERQSREDVASWYRGASTPNHAPPSYEDQALALAIASLPDVPADLVTLAAADLKETIETGLRDMTEEEQNAQPRGIGLESLSDRLARVGAERVRINDSETERPVDVIRFKKARWDYDLLEHIWIEREDVRKHYIDWLAKVVTNRQTHTFGRYAAQTVGTLARDHFASIQIMVLSDWLQVADPRRLSSLVPVISDVLTAAVEERHNVNEVKRILLDLAKRNHVTKNNRYSGQQAALELALGELGLRRPSIAIHIMKSLGWNIFKDENFRIVTRSATFYGSQTLEEADFATDDGLDEAAPEADIQEDAVSDNDGDITPSEGLDEDDEAPKAAEEDTSDAAPESDKPDQADQSGARASAALPAMTFIAALADWANEPIKARTKSEQEDGKLQRQVPLAALMLIFGGMPLLSRRKSNRLTLEEVMRISTRWDADLLNRITVGFRRAGMATKYRGDRSPHFARHYFPPQHLANVFRGFAHERWMHDRGKGVAPDERPDAALQFPGDPLLEFAQKVHTAIDEVDQASAAPRGSAAWVLRRMGRFLTQEEKTYVTTARRFSNESALQ